MTTSTIRSALFACATLSIAVSPFAGVPSASAQSCPNATYSGSGTYGPSESGSSHEVSGSVPPDGVATFWGIAWNHATGAVSAGAGGSCGFGGGGAFVRSSDEFTLVGPAGGPVTISVNAAAQVALGAGYYGIEGGPPTLCTASASARFRLITPTDSTEISLAPTGCPAPSITQVLSLPAEVTPGVPFTVAMFASGNASCGAGNAKATLSFADVPVGYSIQSCGGFIGSVIVPARRATWGQLKTRYR